MLGEEKGKKHSGLKEQHGKKLEVQQSPALWGTANSWVRLKFSEAVRAW